MRQTTVDELRRAVSILSGVAKQPLSLAGAYSGWRVEDDMRQDFLGTGYIPKKQMFHTIRVVLQFHRNTSK